MAEELLGLDFEIHGGGSDLIFPHHENEAAQTRAARGTRSRGCGCTTAWSASTRPRWRSRWATSSLLHDALDRLRPRRADHVLLRRALSPAASSSTTSALEEASARVKRIREAARKLIAGRVAAVVGAAARARSSTLWPTTSTRRGRSPRCSTGSARPTPPSSPVGDARPARDARRPGAREPARGRDGATRRPRRSSCSEAREQARAARDYARGRPSARRAARAGLGGPDGSGGPSCRE